jgi:tetratricopeptide (TPR) repeat protein
MSFSFAKPKVPPPTDSVATPSATTVRTQSNFVPNFMFGRSTKDPVEELKTQAKQLFDTQQYEHAIKLYEEAYTILTQKYGNTYSESAFVLTEIGKIYSKQENYSEAIKTLMLAQSIIDNTVSPIKIESMRNLFALAMALEDNGDAEMALPYYRRNLVNWEWIVHTRDNVNLISALGGLGSVFLSLGRYKDALPLYEEALERRRRLGASERLITLSDTGVKKAHNGIQRQQKSNSNAKKHKNTAVVAEPTNSRLMYALAHTPQFSMRFLNGLVGNDVRLLLPPLEKLETLDNNSKRITNTIVKHPSNTPSAFAISYKNIIDTANNGRKPEYPGWRMVTAAEWLNREWQTAIVESYQINDGWHMIDGGTVLPSPVRPIYLELDGVDVAVIDHQNIRIIQDKSGIIKCRYNSTDAEWNSALPSIGRNWTVYKLSRIGYQSAALFVNTSFKDLPVIEPLTPEEYSYNPNTIIWNSLITSKLYPAPWITLLTNPEATMMYDTVDKLGRNTKFERYKMRPLLNAAAAPGAAAAAAPGAAPGIFFFSGPVGAAPAGAPPPAAAPPAPAPPAPAPPAANNNGKNGGYRTRIRKHKCSSRCTRRHKRLSQRTRRH